MSIRLTYKYENTSYPITYKLGGDPLRLFFNHTSILVPPNWNTLPEDDKFDWLHSGEFLEAHDEHIDEEISGGFGGILTGITLHICDILLSNNHEQIQEHNNATCDFDEMIMIFSNGVINSLSW